MPHNGCQSCFSLGHGKDAGIHRHLASRQREGVGRLVVFDDRYFPLKLVRHRGILRTLGRFDDAGRHALDRFDLARILRRAHLGVTLDLIVSLRPHLHFLRHGGHEQLRPSCVWIGFAPHQRDERHTHHHNERRL